MNLLKNKIIKGLSKLIMKSRKIILPIIIIAILALADQIIKFIVVKNIDLYDNIPIIEGVFEITYIRNTGSAWGILAGKTTFLLIMTLIVFLVSGYVYNNIIDIPKYKPMRICLVILIGGAVGNMIDRIRLGYVIDYLYFKLIDFPVFNLADIFVTISLLGILILIIFKYNNSDFDIMIGDKKGGCP